MLSIQSTLYLFVAMLAMTTAFKSIPRTFIGKDTIPVRAATLKLNAWGLQKLGQSVISINNTVTVNADPANVFFGRRNVVSTGNDERLSSGTESVVEVNREQHYQSLSNIDKSFRQQTLLMGLSSPKLSNVEKLGRIELASSVENLLPSALMKQSIVQSVDMHSGGLMNAWQFDLE
jgi:hypothetical protein